MVLVVCQQITIFKMYATYKPQILTLRDKSEPIDLMFHIKSDDYFATLATVLNLILDTENELKNTSRKSLINARENLIYLQRNYQIRERYK